MSTHPPTSTASNLQSIEVTPNKENARIIWLDATINDLHDPCHTKDRVLEMNSAALFYTDLTKCVTFMKSSRDEQILLIVSGIFAPQLLSQVHNLRPLAVVFILCENCPSCPSCLELLKKYSTIINLFTDRNSLLLSIEETLGVLEKQLLAFSFFDQKQTSTRDLSKESTSFIWHQLLIDTLRKMPHDEKAKDDMLVLCSSFYATNKKELKEIEDFKNAEMPKEAIPWYTKECFLYKLLNRAIRTEDIELLYSFRVYIADLCDQLEKESEKLKTAGPLKLYRGQLIPNEELKKLHDNAGGLISTNGFLSTSRLLKTACNFLEQYADKNDMTKCILEIHADPSLKSVVFADIDQHSKIEGEQEVLFGLNATFKVGSIDMDSKLQRIKVTLTATDDGATHFEKHMKQQQYEMKDYCPMVYFGRILWRDLGRADQAKKYFDMLLKALPPDHPDMSDVYNEIAPLWAEMGDQDKALKYYEKAYAIREKTLEQNHPKISISLNNIGITYAAMGKHDDALDFYRRSLAINKEITPEPNQDWALRLLNIGIVYRLKKEYDRALEFVHQAYDIYKRIRPDQHRDIAWCLGAIGDVYYEKGNIDRALDYYHQQLEMNEKCLSLDHPDISANLQRLADIYVKQGERPKALSFCEQKLVMQENTLGKIHPRIASTLMTIGKLRGEYRNYLEQALNILEKYTPKDDLRTIECLEELADLDMKENNLKDSLAHWMCILDIRRRIHSPDNPKIGFTLWTIGDIYFRHFQNYSEALHYSLESLAVYCANYGPQDNNIIEINRRISMIHAILDDDEDDCKDAEENMTDHLSSSESVTDTPASTTLSSLVTPSNSSASTDQTKNNASSGICVLL